MQDRRNFAQIIRNGRKLKKGPLHNAKLYSPQIATPQNNYRKNENRK